MDDEADASPASGDEVTLEQAQAVLSPAEGADEAEPGENQTGEDDELEQLAGTEAEGETEPVEIEYEGKSYKLPPELKDALLRQTDYTKKTMALSDDRKAFEATKEQFDEIAGLSQESRKTFVEAAAKRIQLNAMLNMSIEGLTQDQINALRLDARDLEQEILGLETKGQQAELKERDLRGQQLAKARESIVTDTAKILPKFNDQRRTELDSVAVSLGASPEFVQQITDPLVYKTLHFADIGMKFVERQRKAATLKDAQQSQPAALVSGKAQSGKRPSEMSPSEMAKHLGLPQRRRL